MNTSVVCALMKTSRFKASGTPLIKNSEKFVEAREKVTDSIRNKKRQNTFILSEKELVKLQQHVYSSHFPFCLQTSRQSFAVSCNHK